MLQLFFQPVAPNMITRSQQRHSLQRVALMTDVDILCSFVKYTPLVQSGHKYNTLHDGTQFTRWDDEVPRFFCACARLCPMGFCALAPESYRFDFCFVSLSTARPAMAWLDPGALCANFRKFDSEVPVWFAGKTFVMIWFLLRTTVDHVLIQYTPRIQV